jgi:hypothetical protein
MPTPAATPTVTSAEFNEEPEFAEIDNNEPIEELDDVA